MSISSTWSPTDSGLKEICELLAEYQKPSAHHAQIYQRVQIYESQPEFSNYLIYLLTHGANFSAEVEKQAQNLLRIGLLVAEQIRQCAGLLLKNKLRYRFHALPESALLGLTLPSQSLRQTAATVISALVYSTGLQHPDLLLRLTQLMESREPLREAALDTVLKICEDCPQVIEAFFAEEHQAVLHLLQLITRQFLNETPEIRRAAVATMNIVIELVPSSHDALIQEFREGLFLLHADSDAHVRKEVCQGMTQLVTFHQECMIPCLKSVIQFMLECARQSDVSIAMESCEFWTAFVDASLEPGELRPFLGELLPILFRNMVYDDDDEDVVAARETEEEPKPFIPSTPGEVGERDRDEEAVESWTLRKCSAAGLDKLSTMFGNGLFQHVMPLIQQSIRSPDWRQRECSMLILGAVSDGCREALEPYMGELLTEVLAKTEDVDPLVRAIALWTLGRFAERVVRRMEAGEASECDADRIFNAVTQRLHDGNRQVQFAACSALATIEEFSRIVLIPRLKCILECLAKACRHYGSRNLRVAYEAIGILADRVGTVVAQEVHRALIMPALMELYDRMDDDDKELQPLFYCLSSLATAFGDAFQEYVIPVYERCLRIAQKQFAASEAEADMNSVVSVFDLVSGMLEGMGASLEPLIGPSRLGELIFHGCRSTDGDLRQSAFALLGELAKCCPSHLRPQMEQFLALAVENFAHEALKTGALSACNNACWAVGVLALNSTRDQLLPVEFMILEQCVNIMIHEQSLPRNLVENATITLGRAALLCAANFAPHLHVYVAVWSQMLRGIRDDIEKEQAFMGLFKTLELNPAVATQSFPSICMAIASWTIATPPPLQAHITEVMKTLTQRLHSDGQWEVVWAQVPPAVQQKLQQSS